jgi:hypothetical protein
MGVGIWSKKFEEGEIIVVATVSGSECYAIIELPAQVKETGKSEIREENKVCSREET